VYKPRRYYSLVTKAVRNIAHIHQRYLMIVQRLLTIS
jgi:hypothetical protein